MFHRLFLGWKVKKTPKNKNKLLVGGVALGKMGLRVSNILTATSTESREHITLRVLSLDILPMNAGLHLGTTLLL